MSGQLFQVAALDPAPPVPVDDPTPLKMTARDIKDALRGRHPSDKNDGGMVGQWTCIEEWRNIDLLALNAWKGGDVIGYEVKVSRSDMRHELLRPDKRADAVAMTTEFYFAVPAGMLTAEEIAFDEPAWAAGDFEREMCPGVPEFGGKAHQHSYRERWGGRCVRYRGHGARHTVPVPVPEVIEIPEWHWRRDGETAQAHARRYLLTAYREERYAPCWTCGGKGYLEKSRVEREAPTLWVPHDVGLVVCGRNGTRVVKASPKRKNPEPIADGRRALNDLVRWVSHRPDRRHRAVSIDHDD